MARGGMGGAPGRTSPFGDKPDSPTDGTHPPVGGGYTPSALSTIDRVRMARLCGRAWGLPALTALNGGSPRAQRRRLTGPSPAPRTGTPGTATATSPTGRRWSGRRPYATATPATHSFSPCSCRGSAPPRPLARAGGSSEGRGGSGGSLEPPASLPAHLHTGGMAYPDCLPTRSTPPWLRGPLHPQAPAATPRPAARGSSGSWPWAARASAHGPTAAR